MPKSATYTRTARQVLSEEELTLLAAFPAAGRVQVDVDEAVRRTGLPRGLAALGLELLSFRGLA